jgi:hypothetical protein
MVILGSWNGQALSLSIKQSSLTISIQSKAVSQVFSFDAEGRLWTAMLDGVSYRRGLDGKTVAKWQDYRQNWSLNQRGRRWLLPDRKSVV